MKGFNHNISFSAPQRIFEWLSINPNINLKEDWVFEYREPLKDENNNFIYASTPRDDGLPTLTAIADAYRHAATSAIVSKERGKTMTNILGYGQELVDVAGKGKELIMDTKTPFTNKFNKAMDIFGDSSMDVYNNRLGLKYSGSKSDVLNALNVAFEKQLNRMKDPNYKFEENVDFRFDKR